MSSSGCIVRGSSTCASLCSTTWTPLSFRFGSSGASFASKPAHRRESPAYLRIKMPVIIDALPNLLGNSANRVSDGYRAGARSLSDDGRMAGAKPEVLLYSAQTMRLRYTHS